MKKVTFVLLATAVIAAFSCKPKPVNNIGTIMDITFMMPDTYTTKDFVSIVFYKVAKNKHGQLVLVNKCRRADTCNFIPDTIRKQQWSADYSIKLNGEIVTRSQGYAGEKPGDTMVVKPEEDLGPTYTF